MKRRILKYKIKKTSNALGYVVYAKIEKRSLFGCLIGSYKEVLDSRYRCDHEYKGYFRYAQVPVSKEKAKIIADVLNKTKIF